MLRIFVLMEEFNDINQMRTILKKVGCDVDTNNMELGFKEKIISFKPDIIIVSGAGKRINPASISKKLKDINTFDCKIILILGQGVKISLNDLAENKFDAFLESPFDPVRLMTLLSQMSNNKAPDLVEKFQKLVLQGFSSASKDVNKKIIKGNFVNKSENEVLKVPDRLDEMDKVFKYSQMVDGLAIGPTTINKDEVKKRLKDMQQSWDRKTMDDIDAEKRDVARKLFKKAK